MSANSRSGSCFELFTSVYTAIYSGTMGRSHERTVKKGSFMLIFKNIFRLICFSASCLVFVQDGIK